jgi:acetate kinase
VLAAEARGEERGAVAVDLFVRRLVLLAGGYLTLLGGRGALVFGGGIGAGSAALRARVAAGVRAWNVVLDDARNAAGAPGCVSAPGSRPVFAFAADEEGAIAREAARSLGLAGPAGR